MTSSKSKNLKITATIISFIAIVLIVILITRMFEGNSSYTTTGEDIASVGVLSCTANTKVESFLDTELANGVEHKIIVTFGDGRPDEISYGISAMYADKAAYDDEGRIWVTDYGLYMAQNNLRDDSIKNTFLADDDRVHANFYTKVSDINMVTGKIFLLNDGNYAAIRNYDMRELAKYYSSLGFNCEEINNKETK